jgi:predicted nucleic acid-binding protein
VPVFVDTNVLVYARDTSNLDKQQRARRWVEDLWRSGQGRLSAQVLEEYYVTVTRKLSPGLSRAAARADVEDLATWRPLAIDRALLRDAFEIEDAADLSFWDALIVAAAHAGGSEYLLSEDLQPGRRIGEVTVVDPFEMDPGDLVGPLG